jgi:hypothetical protein
MNYLYNMAFCDETSKENFKAETIPMEQLIFQNFFTKNFLSYIGLPKEGANSPPPQCVRGIMMTVAEVNVISATPTAAGLHTNIALFRLP